MVKKLKHWVVILCNLDLILSLIIFIDLNKDISDDDNSQDLQATGFKPKRRSGLVSLFNGISTFLTYLMPKPSWKEDSSGTI